MEGICEARELVEPLFSETRELTEPITEPRSEDPWRAAGGAAPSCSEGCREAGATPSLTEEERGDMTSEVSRFGAVGPRAALVSPEMVRLRW